MPIDQQIAVTIWRLATNVEYQTILVLFGIGISTVYDIVHRICYAMAEHILPKYVKSHQNNEFQTLQSFP